LTFSDHARATSERVAPRPLRRPFLAPHWTLALIEEGALGAGPTTRSTLDLGLQRDVEGLVRTHIGSIRDRGATNAALLVADNRTGEVLAYVGSADFDDPTIAGQIDMVRARRQPGSTLKPFVYAMAFAAGHAGSDLLADVPTSFAEGSGTYAPGNFDGSFEGPISAREALAGSLNVPVIRLAAELPPGALLAKLRELGLESLEHDAGHYGLALALGSGEVELRELAVAYVALARGGDRIPLRFTVPFAAALGEKSAGTRVLDPGVTAMVTEILSDPLARVRGLHGRGPFDLGFPVALKTGTSSGFRDTWTAGYTHERTVVVWVGNADGAPTQGLTGASAAGPLFADVMRRAMRDVPTRAPLFAPDLLMLAEVCPLSGKLAGPACSEHAPRHFLREGPPTETCDLHVRARLRPEASAGEPPFQRDAKGPSRIVVLPEVFDAWLAHQPLGAPGHDSFGLPWFSCARLGGCVPLPAAGEAELRIDAPLPGSVFLLSRAGGSPHQAIEVRASVAGSEPGRRIGLVEFVVDGRVAAEVGPPYRALIPLTRGDHEVVARPADPVVRIAALSSRFSVR
jgi:penicillin-binding protein 1C